MLFCLACMLESVGECEKKKPPKQLNTKNPFRTSNMRKLRDETQAKKWYSMVSLSQS